MWGSPCLVLTCSVSCHRYQSTVMGSYQTVELIETFINYQESIKRCIALVVDPASYASGTPALKVTLEQESETFAPKPRQF